MGFLLRSSSWPLEWPLAALAVAAWLYWLGGRRSASGATAAKRLRGTSFYAGLLAVALAVSSPVAAYDDRLFWAHMVQHVLLTMVAPPLLLLGRPWPRLARPHPASVRLPVTRAVLVGPRLARARRVAEEASRPLGAFVLFAASLLLWHVPALYDLTLRHALVHDLEHGLFFGTALLFWRHALPGVSPRRSLGDAQAAVYATGGMLAGWLLAVILGVASAPLYAYGDAASRTMGLSPLNDQQLAAGIMWVPGSVPLTIAIFVAAYRALEPSTRRRVLADDLRPRET
ncbi:MAG TPA: cytochrome c oxidase assembly protein [Gaiellaceae bacterium]